MSNKIRYILLIVFLGLLICISSICFFVYNQEEKNAYSSIEVKENNNYVQFNDDVLLSGNAKEIQKNFNTIEMQQDVYILKYEKELPSFFENMKTNDIFCVYPDNNSEESFFSMGFCGKYISKRKEGNSYYVSFRMPSLTEVFSDVYINTKGENGTTISSSIFFPNDNIEVDDCDTETDLINSLLGTTTIYADTIKDSISIGDTEVGFNYKKSSQQSELDGYTLLCDKLKLKLKNKSEADECDIILNGSVTLEEPAVKMVLDYHYDKKKDQLKINDYSLGLITKQKIELSIEGEKEVGLDDLNVDLSDLIHVIDIEDTTELEKGKIVLGTYLIGMEAALPILYNDTNKVNYLSLGVAIQLTITASGKLSLEYNIEESGFTQVEVNEDGNNIFLSKGYDYPNPVVDKAEPTEEQKVSVPEVATKVKGEASIDVGLGIDAGMCVLGMIPIKVATNVVEMEVTRSFIESESNENDSREIYRNQYLLDDDINYMIVSSNAYLKMYLGAKIKLGALKYNVGKAGSSFLLYKDVAFQYPNPTGFTHSQCGFGGIFVGEQYTDDELYDAYEKYKEDVGIDGIISSAKDSLVGTVANSVLSSVGYEIIELSDYIGEDVDEYTFDYYSTGALYVRNSDNVVIAEFISDEKIMNAIGFRTGLLDKKTEEIYSSPSNSYNVDVSIGWVARKLLGIDDIEDMEISYDMYKSTDSNEKMELIYSDDELKLIIVTSGK